MVFLYLLGSGVLGIWAISEIGLSCGGAGYDDEPRPGLGPIELVEVETANFLQSRNSDDQSKATKSTKHMMHQCAVNPISPEA